MNILLLVPEFPPTTCGGLANYSYNIAKHLTKNHNVKVSVIVSQYPFRRYISNFKYTYRAVKKINELKKNEELDIVYAVTFRPDFLIIGLYAKIVGLPLVFHGVGLDVYTSHPLFAAARRMACQVSDQLICGANFQKEMITREGTFPGKVSVILGGVDTEVFRPLPAMERDRVKRFFNVEDKFVLLSLGRLVKRKGFNDAIEALTYLRDKDDIVLLIVGDGPEKGYLEKLVERHSLGDMVRFLGFQPTTYLPAAYNVADLFVAPFKVIGKDMEGTPLVVQEALSCGIPVISTNTAGLPELIENCESGFTVNMNAPKKIAEKIRLLYDNRKLHDKMTVESRERAKKLLDWKVVIAKTENVLEAAINK